MKMLHVSATAVIALLCVAAATAPARADLALCEANLDWLPFNEEYVDADPQLIPESIRGFAPDCQADNGLGSIEVFFIDRGFDEYVDMITTLEAADWVPTGTLDEQSLAVSSFIPGANAPMTEETLSLDEVLALSADPAVVVHRVELETETSYIQFFRVIQVDSGTGNPIDAPEGVIDHIKIIGEEQVAAAPSPEATVEPDEEPTSEEPEATEGVAPWLVIAGVAAGVVVLVVVVALIARSRRRGKSGDGASTDTPG